jgi:class 3 adenylate cyclase/tetratricopeptide (TPR) repeat protein
VTIVFADLIGSVSLHERQDAESARRFMDRYHRAMTAAVEVHGGRVIQLLGDGVLAAFGVPRVAEDDAIRAVRAASGMQRAFRELVREQGAPIEGVGLRVAVNTGEVVVSDDETAVIGDPTNVAARLQREARDGDVIVGESTQRLVGDLVTLEPLGAFVLKGRSETVAAWRLVSLDRPASARTTAFVGRDEELRRLLAVYDTAVATPAARMAVLLGSPGLGKSRLLAEVARRAGERATVLSARCEATGGATFAPLAEALRSFLRIEEGASDVRAAVDAVVPGDDAERARIAGGIDALFSGAPSSPEEIFFAVRRLLAAFAGVRPVVLVIDDLHWAAPLLLDLVEHLVQWSAGVPLFLLVAARPELRDARSSLATTGPLVAEVVTLGGLDAGASMRLAAGVLGASELPAALVGRVLATSEGNPLFLGELVRMLVQDGTLVREGERWVTAVEIAKLDMPPTIQVLLAARIERLRPEERSVLERAAVVGRQFSRAAVAHLLADGAADLDARLEALRRSELIESDTGWYLGEPVLRFHHVLIRDAAYRRVLKETRAQLHERLADWIVSRVGEAIEHEETLGWHLEQAHRNLRELGPLDARGRTLGERAARHLGAAGRRALARDDLSLAAGLLGRALDALDPAHVARADLALDWCEALLSAGDVAPAERAIHELGRFLEGSERLRAWHTCFRGQLAGLSHPESLHAAAGEVAAAAATLAGLSDAAGEAKAHAVHAGTLARLGEVGACEAALDKALAAARRARDRRRANAVLSGAPQAALWGPSPVTRASGRCLDVVRVLRITQGAPAVEAVALRCQALLETLRGRSEAARRMVASARRMVEELGIAQQLLETDVFAGQIELLEGDADEAERLLRAAYDGLREHGLGIDAARAAALLGKALLELGRAREAEALSHESEALAGDDLKAAMGWRGVRAEALARRGEHADAIELARAAVEIGAKTDDLLDHADARISLATALRAAGRHAEADAEERRAIELWEAKGATLLVDRTRRGAGRGASQPDRASAVRGEPTRETRGRVRGNAATANIDAVTAAVTARDIEAAAGSISDDFRVVHHPTGLEYGRDDALAAYRDLMATEGARVDAAIVAALGDSLALCRHSAAASGWPGTDAGAFELTQIFLVETAADGRARRLEMFAADKLGDAVVRLYELHAELLPDGPERERAATTRRSVAALFGSLDLERYRTAFAPALEFVDHRSVGLGPMHGAEALLGALRSLLELAADVSNRIDDVLGLRSGAVLVRLTNFGTDRTSGGAYERPFLMIWVFGSDGLATRCEQFDVDREAEALARFDALTVTPAAARAAQRRVRPNAATAYAARVDSAFVARDVDGLLALLSDDYEMLDHPSGVAYDREAELSSHRALLRARHPMNRHEPLATLGDSLALCLSFVSARGYAGDDLDVGAYERPRIILTEVDAQGRARREDSFAADHLGDAVARLYERYAGLLPEGPERDRAAAMSRSFGAFVGPIELDRFAAAFAAEVESVDHRILGTWSARGRQGVLEHYRAVIELTANAEHRDDDVLGLNEGACLVRRTHLGTDRASGGSYERSFLVLHVFGADGLMSRWEIFDSDREAEALARFDELTPPPRTGSRRRVRPNAATALEARLCAVIAARDAGALPALVADDLEVKHRPTHSTYGREEVLHLWRSLIDEPGGAIAIEPLATLGDSLALGRNLTSASAASGRSFDFGAYEIETVSVDEVDAQGRRRRAEFFGPRELGDAVTRLFERHAELLPEGPDRARAAATARAVAGTSGLDCDDWAAAVAPDVEWVDRRTLGLGPAHGAEALLRGVRSLHEAAHDIAIRVDDVLDLRSNALLIRRTNLGTDRIGGGSFERPFLMLLVFGADGLLQRGEQFDPDRDAEALARFDALAVEKPRPVRPRVRPNAATAVASRINAAFARRDADAARTLVADGVELIDHTAHAEIARGGLLAGWESMLSVAGLTYRLDPLASLGRSAICRRLVSAGGVARGDFDVGAYEIETLNLIEVDAQERLARLELFAPDRLGDAVACLYERHAERLPDGPERIRAAATARSAAIMLGPLDVDRLATAIAPDIELVDDRTLGSWSARGAEAALIHFRSLLELADQVVLREVEVLDLRGDALLTLRTHRGIDRIGGGPYERQFLMLLGFGADGLISRMQWFDDDRHAEARARFDALTAPPRPVVRRRVRPNAATANAARVDAAVAAQDAAAFADLYSADANGVDHISHVPWDRQTMLSAWHSLVLDEHPTCRHEPLATLGDSLALYRMTMAASGAAGRNFDVGAYAIERINLIEVDAQERRRWAETFPVERLGDAIARFYARHAEQLPAGPERVLAEGSARVAAAWLGRLDPDRYAAALRPDIEVVDHRILGTWSVRSAEAHVQNLRSWVDVADDITRRADEILALRPDALLARWTHLGTDRASGGAYERPFLLYWAVGSDGLASRWELFDSERTAEALARFDELVAQGSRPFRLRVRPNAVTQSAERIVAAVRARDPDALAGLFSDDFEALDHSTGASYGRDGAVATGRMASANRDLVFRQDPLATLGERLALLRNVVSSSGVMRGDMDVGAFETVSLVVAEVEEYGRRRRNEWFRPERLGDAVVRLYERYAELLPEGPERARAAGVARTFAVYSGPMDLDRYARTQRADLLYVDHRVLGFGSTHGSDTFRSLLATLLEAAPDSTQRFDEVLALRPDAWLIRNTNLGTDRRSGGTYERPYLLLVATGADSLVTHIETFDLDREADALARFDELGAEARHRVRRRVRPNAATANPARVDAAIAARDADVLPVLFGDDWAGMDHTTHTAWDRRDVLSSWRSLALAEDPASRHEPLATLGDSLALLRVSVSASRLARGSFDVGAYEKTDIQLIEVDAQGRQRRGEVFAVGQLGDAVARFYERYAELLPAGRERTRAAATAHSLGVTLQETFVPDRYASACSPGVEVVDHRPIGTMSARGREAHLKNLRSWLDVAAGVRNRIDDVLALRSDALLLGWTNFGRDRSGGGSYERPFLMLGACGPDGLLCRFEYFDLEQEDAALARFDALAAAPPPAARFANAATRTVDEWFRCQNERDWDGAAAILAPGVRLIDRRPLFGSELAGSDVLTNFRVLFDIGFRHWRSELLATRGERLALFRGVTETEDAAALEFLLVTEVDGSGRGTSTVLFEPGDLEAACAELDQLYAVGEGAPFAATLEAIARLLRLIAARDWDRFGSMFAAEFVLEDRRPLGWGTLHALADFVGMNRAMVELRPDATFRIDHILDVAEGSLFFVGGWTGSDESGAFEIRSVVAWRLDADRRIRHVELFTLDQLDEARARYAELTRGARAS